MWYSPPGPLSTLKRKTLKVTPAPGWTIARVEYSTDGINWLQATPGTDDNYSVVLTNLDIGTSELTLRVTSTYLDQTEVNLFYSEIKNVAAVFDCTAPTTSMLPSSTMILQDGTEVRTLVGYFGDPLRGHAVVAYIDFTDEPAGGGAGSAYQIEGVIDTYARTEITASFQVSHATCIRPVPAPPGGGECTGPCSVNYGLTVLVDGVQICTSADFGVITNLCPG